MANFEKPTKSICTTCIHRYVCKYLFIYDEEDFKNCTNYKLDESTVSKRKFAKVCKKVKSFYPVKSDSLCIKCKNYYTHCPYEFCEAVKKQLPTGGEIIVERLTTICLEDGKPCKHFIIKK